MSKTVRFKPCNIFISINHIAINRIYNQQMRSSASMFEGKINSRQKIAVFMVQKMLERRRNEFSSQKLQRSSYQKRNHLARQEDKKTFTISYAEDNFVEKRHPIYRLKEYRQEINKVNQIPQSQEKNSNSHKSTKKNFRIKSYTSINEGQIHKVVPLVLKYMRETLKDQGRYKSCQQIQQQPNQFYGLKIRQVKTYKFIGKKQKVKQRLMQYQQDKKRTNDSIVQVSTSLQVDKSHNSSKGGGFNILVKRHYKSKSKLQDTQESYLRTVACKKPSLLSEASNSQPRKKKDVSMHNLRFANMISCLDIILNSFHLNLKKQIKDINSIVYIQDTNKKASIDEGEKFTYFVGNGNNAQLIKTMLKKRGWWTEVSDVSKATFIWTQIKIVKIIKRQPTLSPQKSLVQPILCYQNDIKNDNSSNLLKTSSNFITKRQEHTTLFNLNKIAYRKLFHERQSTKYYNPLSQIERRLRLQSIFKPYLYHNHFQFNHIIGNKNSLYFNIRLYCDFTRKDLNQIVPQTYYLEINNQKDLQCFEQRYDHDSLWILKPGENSNRGQRITLAKSIQEIKLKLSMEKKLIVQSYIKNPLLYNGRKFDIRTYLLGVNLNGRLKFYFYEQGYIKTSSFPYSLKDINDKYVHLTNDAIQQTSDKYGKYEEGNKLSYSEFQRYLESKYQKQGYNIQQLHQQMRKDAIEVVKATYYRINTNKRSFCFELFGLDYLIDSKFKPYLIEVNTNPCLELCSHSLERLIPRMIQSLFRLCLDPLFRPRCANNTKAESYYFYDERFLEKNQFRLIFDERYDKDIQWQKYGWECQRRNQSEFNAQEEQLIQ